MGFKKDAAPVMEKTEVVVTAPVATTPAPVSPVADKPSVSRKKDYSPDEARVRGQVRMHAVIAGYKVASSLAPTLANTSASIKDELHKLAVEVAAKIEAYSFLED